VVNVARLDGIDVPVVAFFESLKSLLKCGIIFSKCYGVDSTSRCLCHLAFPMLFTAVCGTCGLGVMSSRLLQYLHRGPDFPRSRNSHSHLSLQDFDLEDRCGFVSSTIGMERLFPSFLYE